jgi:hypothetical protein
MLRWEDYDFKARLGYTARPCLKKKYQIKISGNICS